MYQTYDHIYTFTLTVTTVSMGPISIKNVLKMPFRLSYKILFKYPRFLKVEYLYMCRVKGKTISMG